MAGGGIAGLSSAAFLARAGHKVVIYDKAPEPRPVGSGLIVQPTGQSVLAELGLLEALVMRGARLKRLDGRLQGGKRKVLDVRYDALGAGTFGLAVHRAALFDLLLHTASEAKAELDYGEEVSTVEASANGVSLRFADGRQSPSFDLMIDALGVRSPLVERQNCYLPFGALWANAPFPLAHDFDETVLAQRYRSANVSSGVMPIGSMEPGGEKLAAFFWTLRADSYQAWRDAPLDQWKDKVLELWPEAAPVLSAFTSHDQFVFAHYAHHTAKHAVEGRIVHIGDAWHAASPQLGQGANMALLDALALSNALNEMDDIGAALAMFVNSRRDHVRLYQTISWLFTPVYQSNLKLVPALRDLLAQPLSAMWPMPKLLASMVAGTLGRPCKS
ncbi:NAD(P)/FAD-dependent oxidoreductase [Hyphococcus flavus]|uniref:NAD(P)/FAD-dependent oxidoreductase n=1 Tax=Hyphococcus flavus TaxID=1866326 RepID=A0AAF0CIV3_9PROT|nr:NAD(P)/FAD-dependent oxidoreductase [Hyphococcus flavus]WDI33252.1 NAD(P)/FAD-dependent oxidoreductase [Hyphococcus flavus]